ncbi:hypothetical protein H072_6125 [Dactylellina haptotyla CBS 200.50]|uniref:Swi5-dependent recombination DNA repair protein 1 n=1 Tax=Dactylellina haptotyla (strain CBS 200.50) TaxID=1284197 RepID=S8AFY3_DACHA|nr:hypothetical protein H072_6125 [Dactylellina haptotyla CBS 200.50]
MPKASSPTSPPQEIRQPEHLELLKYTTNTNSGYKSYEQDGGTYQEDSSSLQNSWVESQPVFVPASESSLPKLDISKATLEDDTSFMGSSVREHENLETSILSRETQNDLPALTMIAESPPSDSSLAEPAAPPSSPPQMPSPVKIAATTPSIPAVKRRRLNSSATNKLMRPFKSPLKVNSTTHTAKPLGNSPLRYPPSTPPRKTTAPYTPLRPLSVDLEETEDSEELSPAKSTCLPAAQRSAKSANKSSNPAFRSSFKRTSQLNLSSPASNSTKDPYILSLEKKHTRLKASVEESKKLLEESAQALQIEKSNEDAKLEELIIKWRQAAQSAADHMFSGAEQRFARMGGMTGYRERQNRSGGGGWGFADDDPEEGLTEDQKEARRQAMYEAGFDEISELEKSQTQVKNKIGKDDGDQFTMDMMLKSLNIDVEIMGYDKVSQGWIK